jgi:fatty acid-binding protein DegV
VDHQVLNSKRGFDPAKFKVTFVLDSTCCTEPWAETAFAHVPIVATIKAEPFPCSFDPPGLGVGEFLNKSRHEEMKVGTAAPPVEAFKRCFESAVKIGKPVICLVLSGLLSKTHANGKSDRTQ